MQQEEQKDGNRQRSNRTFMELKLNLHQKKLTPKFCSNRTFMELKFLTKSRVNACHLF